MATNVIQFTLKGVDQFSSTMKKFGASMASVGKKMVSVAKWAAAAATALIAFVKITADGIDKQAKFATRIGVSVTELSKYTFVANQAGISTEQFQMGIQRMERRVSEAAKGLGESKGALAELGIEASTFSKLGLDQQMNTIADAINNVKDPSDQLRLAFKLFDSEGTAMLQMLKQGSPAMREMAKDAEFLGLAISEQAGANTEHFNDSMGRATGAMKGMSRSIAGELMPILSGLANRFADALGNSRQNIITFVKGAILKFFTFIEVVKQVVAGIKKAFTSKEGFSNFLDNFGLFIKSAGLMAIAWMKGMGVIIWAGIIALKDMFGGFGTWLGGAIHSWVTGKEVADFSDAMANVMGSAMSKARESISKNLEEPVQAFKEAANDAGTAIADSLGVNLEEAENKARGVIQSISEFGEIVREEITVTEETLTDILTELQAQRIEWMEELRNASLQFAEEFFTIMSQTIKAISKGIATVIIEGGNMTKVFQNILKQVLKSVLAALIEMGIKRLVLMAINISSNTAEASSAGAVAVGLAAAQATAQSANAPWPLNLAAPAAGAYVGGMAAAQLASFGGTGAGIGAGIAAAHGGLENVPKESTYLLDKGERVLSPNQNKDFTDFISGEGNAGGLGAGITIENIDIRILDNATNSEALLEMSDAEMEELVAGPIIDALDSLGKRGIYPEERRL